MSEVNKIDIEMQIQTSINGIENKYQPAAPPLNPVRDYRIRPMKPKHVTKKDTERLMKLHALMDNISTCQHIAVHYNRVDTCIQLINKPDATVTELQNLDVMCPCTIARIQKQKDEFEQNLLQVIKNKSKCAVN